MTVIRAKAPVRFCDLGGWTDTQMAGHGAVLSFAAALYTRVTLQVGSDSRISLGSSDTDEFEEVADFRQLEYNNILDLLKAALVRTGMSRGVRVMVSSDAPPASGLGSSAAMGVAVIGALSSLLQRPMLPYEVAQEAHALETEELHQECGVQDQLAAAYGGVNFMEVEYPDARVHRLPLRRSVVAELEDRLVLLYTGRSHFSSAIHRNVIDEAAQSGPRIRGLLDRLSDCAVRGKNALMLGDLSGFAEAINDNWAAQRGLHESIATPETDALRDRMLASGASAFKLNGAGAGGTATVLAQPGRSHIIRQVAESMGLRVLSSRFDTEGLQMWDSDLRD